MTNVGSNLLLPKFISPFRVLRRLGNAYTIELPRKMRTHPTFYVGPLRPYYQYEDSSCEEIPCAQGSSTDTCAHDAGSQTASEFRISFREAERYPDKLPSARRGENAVPAFLPAEQRHTLRCIFPI